MRFAFIKKSLRWEVPSTCPEEACVAVWRRARWARGLLLATLALLAPSSQPLPLAEDAFKADRGFGYARDVLAKGPVSIHVFKLERSHQDLGLATTSGKGPFLGMGTVPDQVKAFPTHIGTPIAAINGDFYENDAPYQGSPRDLQIRMGELLSAPHGHACFWIDPDGSPRMTNLVSRLKILWADGSETPVGLNEPRKPDMAVVYTAATGGTTHTQDGLEVVLESPADSAPTSIPIRPGVPIKTRVRAVLSAGNAPIGTNQVVLSMGPSHPKASAKPLPGDPVVFSTETVPNLAGVTTAIGGGPTLVRDGKPNRWTGFQMRHPRSAIGWSKDYFFLVVVDGRQAGLSVGMTLTELAEYMAHLGCENAMNLDGGGSTTLWALGNVMNNPSEGQERPAANAIVVYRKGAAHGRPLAENRSQENGNRDPLTPRSAANQ